MQNTSIRIIFVLYTYCILIFCMLRVYVQYFLWHCAQVQHSECHTETPLTLCELFTLKSDHLTAAHDCIITVVRSFRWLSNVATAAWSGRPTPLEVSRRQQSVFVVASYYPTSHWRPAFSAHTHHAAGLKPHLTPKVDGWNDCKRLSVAWLETFAVFQSHQIM